MSMPKPFVIVASLCFVLLFGGCGSSSREVASGGSSPTLPAEAQCVLQSPRLAVGEGLDAPGRLGFDVTPGRPSGACADNRAFRFGSGLYDITGVVANKSGMGWENPQHVMSGLHTRLYARAYAIGSPCNGRRIMFVSADIGILWSSLRRGVLAAIAQDEALAAAYGPDNVMLSVTHTHSGPAGYSHDDGGNLFHYGYDALVYQTIVDGIVAAIRLAHANYEANQAAAPIRMAVSELLNTNVNRSMPAYLMNPEAERQAWLNARGEEVTVNKRVVQLNLVRDSGSPVGVINWFGVHPTVVGPLENQVSSDNKGFASLGFERLMRTDYLAPPGMDNFVAAFAQADEGDSSPNIAFEQFPFPDPRRGGGLDDYDSNAISGTKQLAKALELFDSGASLQGPVDYRFFHVQFDEITVDDPVVLAGLAHPPELDAPVKRTCSGVLGASFGAGAEDGRGPTVEGARCDAEPAVLESAIADFETLLNLSINGFPGTWPQSAIPPYTASTAALCNVAALPPVLGDFSCQAEKPVLLPNGHARLPFQLLRIGNLAVLGIPWEVTTVAARRLRALLLDELAPAGVDTVVIAGLVNDYVHYLTTREEYASQQYEGASTLFGPWSLAAVSQESLKLARAMRRDEPAPEDLGPVEQSPNLNRPPYLPSDLPGLGGGFGALLGDVPASAAPGERIEARFQAGHPRNDLKTQSSYAYVEQLQADGSWRAVFQDRDPELIFLWEPLLPQAAAVDGPVIGPSTARIIWQIPADQAPGTYRLRHEGASRLSALVAAVPYSGVSGPVEVAGARGACP
jgi:neutral ceramidase